MCFCELDLRFSVIFVCCDAELDTLSLDSRLYSETVFIHNIVTLSAFVTLGVIPTLYSREIPAPLTPHTRYIFRWLTSDCETHYHRRFIYRGHVIYVYGSWILLNASLMKARFVLKVLEL